MDKQGFINMIAPLAQTDMAKSGILASVTIAQACLESAYGTSELAVNANNLFGMKCSLSGNTWTSVWDGVSRYSKETKEQDKNGNESTITADFRCYPDMHTSICDHSCYLLGAMDGAALRYAGLAGEKDYRKAIQIIKDGGYATDTKYVDKVCNIIEVYGLTKYDGGRRNLKICLDAGHYGKYNQSPADKNYYESELVWKLHLLQKIYLEAYGIEVITTRDNLDTDRGLYDRGAVSRGCDLFISDHTNAVGATINNQVDYPAAYCAINGSADGISMALAQCVEEVMGTRQPARIEHRRGQNGDYYGVLRGASAVGTPGLILEHSFHTNAEIVRWLKDEQNLERLAKAEADIIALYYGLLTPEHKTGWVEENGGWRFYLDANGKYVINDWYKDGEEWYWFDGAGMVVHNTWYRYKGDWYYLGSDGAMVKGLQTDNGRWYYLDVDGRMAMEPVVLTPDKDGVLQYPELVKTG